MEWLPTVCGQLHGEMVKIYWMMILPLTRLASLKVILLTVTPPPRSTSCTNALGDWEVDTEIWLKARAGRRATGIRAEKERRFIVRSF